MSSEISHATDFEYVCPDCTACFDSDTDQCPDCDHRRPPGGWESVHQSVHPYLGKVLEERYLLDRYLGGGASGQVYRAIDRKLKRPFALKILKLGSAGEEASEAVRRFDNEVDALSCIRNPHVINIFESLLLEEQTPAMLTEYIDGETLRAMISGDNYLGVDSAVTLVHQVANGLYEAHSRGIVHRDVKPANIMVEKLPASGSFARILDFGLVHIVDDVGQTRGFWGTPLYAAPEQCLPDREVSAASDIYSLGCVFFHCVTGRAPFVADTARAIMRAQVDEPAPKASQVVDRMIPGAVDTLLGDMLAKDPDERPADMKEIIERLEPMLGGGRQTSRTVVSRDDSDPGLIEESMPVAPETQRGPPGEDGAGSRLSVQSTETRIGVAETAPEQVRTAQLIRSVRPEDFGISVDDEFVVGCLGSDGNSAAVADREGRVYLTSVQGSGIFQKMRSAGEPIQRLVPDVDRGRVLAVDRAGRLLQWRLGRRRSEPRHLSGLGGRVRCVDVAAEDQKIYVGLESGEIMWFDRRVGETGRIGEVGGAVERLSVAPSGRWLMAANSDGDLHALQTGGTGGSLLQIDAAGEAPRAVALDDRVGVVALIGADGSLKIVDMQQSFASFEIDTGVEGLASVALGSDRQTYLLSLDRLEVRGWRLRREKLDAQMPTNRYVDQTRVGR